MNDQNQKEVVYVTVATHAPDWNTAQIRQAEELKKLLERVPASGSFESANLTHKIAILAKEVFSPESTTRMTNSVRTPGPDPVVNIKSAATQTIKTAD